MAKKKKTRKRAKNPAAVMLGRKGGQASGRSMTKKARSERARKGAIAKWKKTKGKDYQPPP